jgi:hypothetical protein
MSQPNEQHTLTLKYVLAIFFSVAATWIVHEFAHWCVGTALGNDMVMTLNACYPVTGKYGEPWHANIISIAGPIITLAQATLFYFLLRKGSSFLVFPFLFLPLYMRTLAGVMNFINLNDEGRVSQAMGIGTLTLPFLFFGILLYFNVDVWSKRKDKPRLIIATLLFTMLFSSVLILSDQFLGIKIIGS